MYVHMCCVVPRALGENKFTCMYKYNAAAYVDVYQAALMRRRTPKHACLQALGSLCTHKSLVEVLTYCL